MSRQAHNQRSVPGLNCLLLNLCSYLQNNFAIWHTEEEISLEIELTGHMVRRLVRRMHRQQEVARTEAQLEKGSAERKGTDSNVTNML
jgi:uncharacterized small protein (DUF1192 family)